MEAISYMTLHGGAVTKVNPQMTVIHTTTWAIACVKASQLFTHTHTQTFRH